MIAGSELDVIAIIGIILLIGIVKKNAIMMIDFALALSARARHTPREAIYKACLAAFSSDPDDHSGGSAWCAAADVEYCARNCVVR